MDHPKSLPALSAAKCGDGFSDFASLNPDYHRRAAKVARRNDNFKSRP